MTKKPGTFSRCTFIKSSAATWGATALAPYTNSLATTPVSHLSASEFMSPPVSSRPMVLWAWLNGHVGREQLTRALAEMRAKGLRGPILWDVASIRDPQKTVPAGPAFLGDESVDFIHHALDEASRLGLEAGLFASSSWNAGGPWIGPELASKRIAWSSLQVTDLLNAGTNRLEVKVTNVWHNRIVGDLKYPDAGEFAKTNMKHKFNADMELLRSGLIGPVVLRQKRA